VGWLAKLLGFRQFDGGVAFVASHARGLMEDVKDGKTAVALEICVLELAFFVRFSPQCFNPLKIFQIWLQNETN
jgi:hypothetical protein